MSPRQPDPEHPRQVRLAHPRFTRSDWQQLWPLLESGFLVQGDAVRRFEGALSGALELPQGHVVAVSSGTAALHLALKVTTEGVGEVIVPALTWPSAANVAQWLGHRVHFVDIDPETLGPNIEACKDAVCPQTVALVPVHPFGLPLARRDFEWANAASFAVIEDAACAFGAQDSAGHRAGCWGTLGCFSLHARKGLTAGEGGFIVSRDAPIADRLRRLRSHGQSLVGGQRVFLEPGLNYRLTEIAATLGSAQLTRFDETLATRRLLAHAYLGALQSSPCVRSYAGLRDPHHAYQSFVVAAEDDVDRDELIGRLLKRGVQSTVGSIAAHLSPYYANLYGLKPNDFPVARWAHEKLIALPLHEQMTVDDVHYVCEALDARSS